MFIIQINIDHNQPQSLVYLLSSASLNYQVHAVRPPTHDRNYPVQHAQQYTDRHYDVYLHSKHAISQFMLLISTYELNISAASIDMWYIRVPISPGRT